MLERSTRAAGPGRTLGRLLVLLTCLSLASATSFAQDEGPRFARLASPLNLADTELAPLEADFVASHPVLRVAVARLSLPPYVDVADDVVSGQAIRFLQSVAAAIGFELELRLYDTWTDVLGALERREADLTPIAGISRDRDGYLDFTVGIGPDPAGLVGRVDDERFARDRQLTSARIAVGRGSVAESYLSNQFPLAAPVLVESAREALRLLGAGEVDYYYGGLTALFFERERPLVAGLEIKQRVYYASGWHHIAVRSDWPIVTRLLDRFARSGRGEIDPLIADVLAERLETSLEPLPLTAAEVEYLADVDALTVGTVAGAPLLNDTDAEGHHIGIASEFTAYLAYQIGRPVVLRSYPDVETMLAGLESGEILVIPYFAITEDRERTLAFSAPYLTMPWVAVGRTDDTLFWDLGSLEGLTLSMRKEHPLLPLVRERYPLIEVVLTDTANESMAAVAAGNADAAVETKLFVNREAQRNGGKIRVLGEVTDDEGRFGFAVLPGESVMRGVIDKSLATMSPDLVDRVVRRWVAVDFEPERRLRELLRVLVPVLIAVSLFLLAALYWNRRIAREYRRRVAAERRLVDMTEGLTTGVFQFRHRPGAPPKMMFSNRVTREMARVAADDDDGSRMSFFGHIDESDRQAVIEKLRHCLSTGKRFRESFRFDFPDGEKGWILADARCRDERDGSRLWNGYLFDLTSERLMSEELNAMLASRNEFVSMASHELRTPVHNIALALASIDRSRVDAEPLARIDSARSAADDLEELVGDIVELTGMNHQSLVIVSEPFDLHEQIRAVCRTFSVAAVEKSLDYTVSVAPALPRAVRGDALRLKQILYNLIGNAIKYTDTGAVSVTAAPDERHADAARVALRITVADTGIGIPKDSLAGIFEPFATIGPASRRSSGLGLALCDRLAAVMGGEIEVSSVEGEGSSFTVSLSLATANGEAPSGEGAPAVSSRPLLNDTSETILVVDDNPMVSELLSSMLEAEGWATRQASSGLEALGILKETSCRAVITDQRMPGMTGTELARRIHASFADGEPRPALILMSGGMLREDAEHASELFDVMLFKPVKTDQIVRAIDDARRRGGAVPATEPAT